MKKYVIPSFMVLSALFATSSALAKKHKSHKAHEHGFAELNLVVEGKSINIELRSPSESIYGFEYEAKKESDIKVRDEAIEKLKTRISEMVILEASLECKFSTLEVKPFVTEAEEHESAKKSKAGKENHAMHSEVHASFKAECSKALAGTKVNFAFGKIFPKLNHIKVQSISGEKQSGLTVKKDKGVLDL
jgi:hypothetical protein